MATRRAQNEYLFAFGFALIVVLFMAVVTWSSGTGGGKGSDASGLSQANAQVAEDFIAPQDFTATQTGSGSGHLTGRAPTGTGTEIVVGSSSSLAAAVGETPNNVPEQTQPPSPEAKTQPATALDTSWNHSTPAPGNIGGSVGGLVGGSNGRRAPSASGGSSGGSSGGYSPTGGMAKATTEPVADAASAESGARAHVSGVRAETGGPAPAAGTSSSGLAISNLSGPLAVPFDNLVSPAAVFADSDLISPLGESLGDPFAVIDQPDLGIGPSSFSLAATPAQQPVAIPEPTTLLLLGAGLAVISQRMRRRRPSPSELV